MMTVRMWKAALWLPLCVVILTVRCGDVGAEWPAEFSIYNVMWAPDGSRLAITYAAFPENTLCMFCSPDWAVATVKPDGSEFRLLTREAGRGTWEPPFSRTPWSPDGRHLALVIDNKIYVMNPDGTDRKRVADGRDLMWSPDGASIVFTASDGTVSISTFDGSKKLTFGQGFGGRFSPNGKMVAFFESLWPDNRYVVHVANVDGADARVLGTVYWYAV
jgi:Tol biopolymer transport system component